VRTVGHVLHHVRKSTRRRDAKEGTGDARAAETETVDGIAIVSESAALDVHVLADVNAHGTGGHVVEAVGRDETVSRDDLELHRGLGVCTRIYQDGSSETRGRVSIQAVVGALAKCVTNGRKKTTTKNRVHR